MDLSLRDTIEKALGGPGMLHDGSAPKGMGYFGPVTNEAQGGKSTELSADIDINGKPLHFPLMTPNQSFQDMSNVLTGGDPSKEMYTKAVIHALSRRLTGRNPFAGEGEQHGYSGNVSSPESSK